MEGPREDLAATAALCGRWRGGLWLGVMIVALAQGGIWGALLGAVSGEPLLPAWLVMPLAGAVMLAIATYLVWIQREAMPASRRRIRTANSAVMLLVMPLLAYALGVVVHDPGDPHSARQFLLTWMAIIGLLGVVVILAGLDAANNVRLYSRSRAELARRSADALAEAMATREAGASREAKSDGGGGR